MCILSFQIVALAKLTGTRVDIIQQPEDVDGSVPRLAAMAWDTYRLAIAVLLMGARFQ